VNGLKTEKWQMSWKMATEEAARVASVTTFLKSGLGVQDRRMRTVKAMHNRQVAGSNFIILLCHSSGIINGFM
jgi:hypothetical protein